MPLRLGCNDLRERCTRPEPRTAAAGPQSRVYLVGGGGAAVGIGINTAVYTGDEAMVARPLLLFTWMLLKEAAVAAANLTSVEYGGLVWRSRVGAKPAPPPGARINANKS